MGRTTVPVSSELYYGGRRGKVWVYAETAHDDDVGAAVGGPPRLEDGLWLLGSNTREKFGGVRDGVGFSTGDVDSDGKGGLWWLEENDRMDALVLKWRNHRDFRVHSHMRPFPIGGTEVYGCDSADGCFVFHQSPNCREGESALTRVSMETEGDMAGSWSSRRVANCPSDTKFASDGAGGLWALMVTPGSSSCKFWRIDGSGGMVESHDWGLPFTTSELVAG